MKGVRDLSYKPLARLIEENIAEYEIKLSRVIEGATSHCDPTLLWAATGLPYDMYNGVYLCDLGVIP